MSNRLAAEKSLYLRQHAENPVDWYPWGPEALAAAEASDKPLLISIGYSACHWCHVMAHESFEDAYIAQLMNKHFVCVKIDREERPDLDQVYMEAVQMVNGSGGWPLNVFCLPDGRPFAGGTYFPPDERRGGGVVPWPQLLMRVANFYERQKDDLIENAEAILKNMAATNHPLAATGEALVGEDYLTAAQTLVSHHDDEWGGFGEAPKFPPSMALNFLLALRGAVSVDVRNPELAAQLDTVTATTLTRMARGGLFDQIGGGFARYSVDKLWAIPHFEKMLYDNALLLSAYTRGWQRHRDPLFAAVVEETVAWLLREMTLSEGGFAAAIDADSEGEEGKFYVWKPDEVAAVLGEEAEAFCRVYAISEEGNFEDGQSHAQFIGTLEERAALTAARERLLTVRDQRVVPGRDPKCLLAWNALLVRGLAEAAFTFGRRDWLETADKTADFLWQTFAQEADGDVRLLSVAYDGEAEEQPGNLDDYAFLADALFSLAAVIDWLEPGQHGRYRDRGLAVLRAIEAHFTDAQAVGAFFTPADQADAIARKKEWFDNALPAGNSCLARALLMAEALTGDGQWLAAADQLRLAYPGLAQRAPEAVGYALSAFVEGAIGLAVVKAKGVDDLEPLRAALVARPWRPVFVVTTDDPAQPAGYQLCVGTECLTPTDDPVEVAAKL